MILNFYEKLSNDYVKLLENGDEHNIIIEVREPPVMQTFKVHYISKIILAVQSHCTRFLFSSIKEKEARSRIECIIRCGKYVNIKDFYYRLLLVTTVFQGLTKL